MNQKDPMQRIQEMIQEKKSWYYNLLICDLSSYNLCNVHNLSTVLLDFNTPLVLVSKQAITLNSPT